MRKLRLFMMAIMTMSCIVLLALECLARGWVSDGYDNWQWVDENGVYATETVKPSGNDKFYLDHNGYMVRDYLLEGYNDSIYYFDDTGKMVFNTWVAVEPLQVENQMDNPPTIYLYYFGSNGKAFKSNSGIIRKTVDGKKYLFNENGQMLSGWINETGERFDEMNTEDDPFVGYCYYAGDETDGVLREGWSSYEDGSVEDKYYLKQALWFYFKPSDNKKIYSENSNDLVKKKINGNTYAFDENGVMIQGWDTDMLDPNNDSTSRLTKNYFSENQDDIGRMHKKEWVFAVPSKKQNDDDHEQEITRWFYALGGGDIVKNVMRKIDSNYYVFNDQGIMKKGLCVIDKATKQFVDCIDVEKTDGRDFIISRHYISTDKSSDGNEFEVFKDTEHVLYYFMEDETDTDTFGRRKIGEVTVAFGDDDYTFKSKGTGEYEGAKEKKYYQAGIKLKADKALGLGLVFLGYSTSSVAAVPDVKPEYYNSTHTYAKADKNHNNVLTDYVVMTNYQKCVDAEAFPVFGVVDGSGNMIKKSNIVKKDKSGHYWLIGANASLVSIYTVPIRLKKSGSGNVWQFKSEGNVGSKTASNSGIIKYRTTWINFGEQDAALNTCVAERTNDPSKTAYVLDFDESYATNFRFED